MAELEIAKTMTKRQISRKRWRDKNKEHRNAYNRTKYALDPAFFLARNAKSKKNIDWRSRDRNTMLIRNYGITLKEYNIMFTKQNGVCDICNQPEISVTRWDPDKIKSLAVDHNHTTGVVRGLLCGKCNTALGIFNDSINELEKAINYLRRHNE